MSDLARIEAVVDDTADARVLKLAALAHELEPARAAAGLAALGVEPGIARAVEQIVVAFWAADLWREGDGAGPGGWLRRAGSGARRSLIFEVVHEGGVTPGMAAAAGLAGLTREAETWRERLLAIIYLTDRP